MIYHPEPDQPYNHRHFGQLLLLKREQVLHLTAESILVWCCKGSPEWSVWNRSDHKQVLRCQCSERRSKRVRKDKEIQHLNLYLKPNPHGSEKNTCSTSQGSGWCLGIKSTNMMEVVAAMRIASSQLTGISVSSNQLQKHNEAQTSCVLLQLHSSWSSAISGTSLCCILLTSRQCRHTLRVTSFRPYSAWGTWLLML